MCSTEMLSQLVSLAAARERDAPILASLQASDSEIQKGVVITSLSEEAKHQLESLMGFSSRARQAVAWRAVRQSLYFSGMHERFDIVENAHFNNFRWILEGDILHNNQQIVHARTQYLDWLPSGFGTFHMAGKHGSGKSTLMKFLCGQVRTLNKLTDWAGIYVIHGFKARD
jgi:hypothetical protein